MFSSGSSSTSAESVAGPQTAVGVDEHVVITSSSVGLGILQADAAAKEKPVPECLLKRTEAISSSRLYSDTQTQQKTETKRRRRERLRKDRNPLKTQNPVLKHKT